MNDSTPPDPTPAEDVADARPPARGRRAALKVLAFGSGFGVMVLEIAGARIMAPVYGLSAVPWTAIIGVVLAALAWGSHLGGRWADEGRIPLATVLLIASVAAVVPLLASALPFFALEALGFIPGAVVSALVFFAPPVVALGAVVPYLVKADTESIETVGRKAGDMGALATAGSIAGTFATGFVFLPLFPLPILIGVTAASIALLAALSGWALGGAPPRSATGGTAVLLIAFGATGASAGDGAVHLQETVYASIAVAEREWDDGRRVRELRQNGGSSSAEYLDTGEPAHRYARRSAALIASAPAGVPGRALVLGGAALTIPVDLRRRHPGMEVDVVEVDPAVTRLAAEYFAFGEHVDDPLLRVHHRDARYFLSRSDERWDVVYLDVFDHLLTVPWTMITVEALELYRAHLTGRGFVMINLLTPLEGPGTELFERVVRAGRRVFPAVRSWPVSPGGDPGVTRNVIVAMALDADHLPPPAEVDPAAAVGDGAVLTDAHAPVEFLQARLLIRGLGW